MNQTGQRRQVGEIEVIGLVQHQIAAHQAQHWRDLPSAALGLGGGSKVIYGTNQQRGRQ
ncbi:hypothetical protein D3C73_1458980 [compost metagenome]